MKRISKLLMIALAMCPCILFAACGNTGLATGEYQLTGWKVGNGATVSITNVTATTIAAKLVELDLDEITEGDVANGYAASILAAINTSKETKIIISSGSKISFKTGTAAATAAKKFEVTSSDWIKLDGEDEATKYKKAGDNIAEQKSVKIGEGPQLTVQLVYKKATV